MDNGKKVKELRELMSVARMLRRGASSVSNRELADLYYRTAAALEDRASRIAFGSPYSSVDEDEVHIHGPVSIVC
jgi:hypothetical protein